MERGKQVRGEARFYDVAGCASGESFMRVVGIGVSGEKHNFSSKVVLHEARGYMDAAGSGERNVEDDQLGLEVPDGGVNVCRVLNGSQDFEAVGEQLSGLPQDCGMVIDEYDARFHVFRCRLKEC